MPFVVTFPKLSPTMEEGTITKWHKKEGDFVEADTLLLEITTDKATVEHEAIDEGWLRKILLPEGSTAHVNEPIAIFTEEENESIINFTSPKKPSIEKAPQPTPTEFTEPSPSSQTGTPTYQQPLFVPEPPLKTRLEPKREKGTSSPLARRLAEQKGLDLTTVKGSGTGGRIVSRDLEYAQSIGAVSFGNKEPPLLPDGTYEELPLSPIRKVIARRLQESKSFIPHFYVQQVVDTEPLVTIRQQLKTLNLKITVNDLILRACALALREHPKVNSGFNTLNQTIVQFKTIDISIAVSYEEGLITPIIRQADFKNLGELSLEVRTLSKRAREGKLKEHEYKGGSFCISNLGAYGISGFSAIINPPQSAILAVGGIEEKAVIKEGKVVPGKSMLLTLSVDHRVIDGADAAQFMKTIQRFIENPVAMTI